MATLWRKAMIYLGLGPDDEYEDFEEPAYPPARPAPAPARTAAARGGGSGGGGGFSDADEPLGAVRTFPAGGRRGTMDGRDEPPRRERPSAVPAAAPPVSGGGAVRRIETTTAKPTVVSPTGFNQAQEIGDKFRDGQPVIMNLQGVDRELSRRLIDFASGLCYALRGQMEKVAQDVFMLTPANVEVPAEERRRLHERGLFD